MNTTPMLFVQAAEKPAPPKTDAEFIARFAARVPPPRRRLAALAAWWSAQVRHARRGFVTGPEVECGTLPYPCAWLMPRSETGRDSYVFLTTRRWWRYLWWRRVANPVYQTAIRLGVFRRPPESYPTLMSDGAWVLPTRRLRGL